MDRFARMIGPLKYFDFRALFFDIAMQAFGGLAPENMDFFCCGARGKGSAENMEEDPFEDLHRIHVLARSFGGPVKNGYACCIDFFNSLV